MLQEIDILTWKFWVSLHLLGCLSMSLVLAQSEGTASISNRYPFIRDEINNLDNALNGLDHFYEQLAKLERGEKRTVSIVHIGDSHLQADIFSGTLREELHKRFGAAGRGLVFPYKVARTTSPVDIKSSSNINWEAKRNIYTKRPLPIGVSGITLRTKEQNFVLKLSIAPNSLGLDYSFNKLTLFSDKGISNYDILLSAKASAMAESMRKTGFFHHRIVSGESLSLIAQKYQVRLSAIRALNNIEGDLIYAGQQLKIPTSSFPEVTEREGFEDLASIDCSDTLKSSFSSTVYLDNPMESIYLRGKKNNKEQNEAIIYGISLENDTQSGLLYNMIGVNGAQFFHYNVSEYFFPQLQELAPDLIIISLGTNETVGKYFNEDRFELQLDKMVQALKKHLPNSDILLTTPPDAYRYRKYKNPHPGTAAEILAQYANQKTLGCWNFYDVMGGYASINTWYRHGLAQSDRLHLTRRGYKLQGRLMYEAIMRAYGRYLTTKPTNR